MIEVKRKILLRCAECGSTDFLIKKIDHKEGSLAPPSTTSITCLKCGHKASPDHITFKTIPLEEEELV